MHTRESSLVTLAISITQQFRQVFQLTDYLYENLSIVDKAGMPRLDKS